MEKEQLQNKEEELEKIDIIGLVSEFFKSAKKLFWLALLIIAICTAGAYGRSLLSYTPVYEAYTSFVVKSNTSFSSQYYDRAAAEQLGKTFPYILTSGVLRDVVEKDLGVSYIPSTIQASVMENTNLFTITVRDSSAQRAYDVLQSVITNYPKVAEYIIGSTSLKVIDESGVPVRPCNEADTAAAALSGMLAGCVISCCILLVYGLRRKTIRFGEDLKKITSAKFLGNVPVARLKKRNKKKKQLCMIDNPKIPGDFREAIRLVRSRVEKQVTAQEEPPVLLVTSAISGEGKSTMACNLALALAQTGMRIALIDGDMRHPSVAGTMGIKEPAAGIEQYLRGERKLESVLLRYEETSLYVIPGISQVNRPVSLIRSVRMKDMIRELKESFDYIIIDTPPCSLISDTAAFAGLADGVIFVVRQDYSSNTQVQRGLESVIDADIPVIGCLLNGMERGTIGYGYSTYGYGKYGYGRYGYGKYGYGKYGYGTYGEKSSGSERK